MTKRSVLGRRKLSKSIPKSFPKSSQDIPRSIPTSSPISSPNHPKIITKYTPPEWALHTLLFTPCSALRGKPKSRSWHVWECQNQEFYMVLGSQISLFWCFFEVANFGKVVLLKLFLALFLEVHKLVDFLCPAHPNAPQSMVLVVVAAIWKFQIKKCAALQSSIWAPFWLHFGVDFGGHF